MNTSERKSEAGYVNASQRDGCRNCRHREQMYADRAPPYERSWLACRKHGFNTNAGAICDSYEQERSTSILPPRCN